MGKWLRRFLKGLVGLLVVVAIIIVGLLIFVLVGWERSFNRDVVAMNAQTDEGSLARGAYLYNEAMFCWGCHGAEGGHGPDEPQSGGTEFDLSAVGPGFGLYYAPNVTPDDETGIGRWSDGELVRVIREGVDRDGKLIFPIMPYQFYHGLSDQDVLALVAYLRSLEPVNNKVPDNQYSLVAKALIGLRLVKPEAAIDEEITAPAPGATAEYGEYLAWHASGCAECHMPRSASSGALDYDRVFGGSLFSMDEDYFSVAGDNLTPDMETGIGDWTKEEFMIALRTGLRPNGSVMIPFMPWPWYGQWSEDDLTAVWLYLRSLEPVNHSAPESKLLGLAAEGVGAERGEALYEVYCADCHGIDRQGTTLVPISLGQAVRQLSDDDLAKTVTDGPDNEFMPGFGGTLSPEQIDDIIRFFRTR